MCRALRLVYTPPTLLQMAAFTVSMSLSAPVTMKARPAGDLSRATPSDTCPLPRCAPHRHSCARPRPPRRLPPAVLPCASLHCASTPWRRRCVACVGWIDETGAASKARKTSLHNGSLPLVPTERGDAGEGARHHLRAAGHGAGQGAWRVGAHSQRAAKPGAAAAFWAVRALCGPDGRLATPRWLRAASSWTWAPTPWTPCVPGPASRGGQPASHGGAFSGSPPGRRAAPPCKARPHCFAASSVTHGPRGV